MTISDTATEKAKEILQTEGKANWGLRIFMAGGGCCGPSFGMDIEETPDETDEVIEKDGLKVFLDQSTKESLDGKVVDYVADGENEGFVIQGLEGAEEPPPSCSSGCSSC